MLSQLLHLWNVTPRRSFAIVIKARFPNLYNWIISSTDDSFQTFNERVFWLLNPQSTVCENGNRKKFTPVRQEYGFCSGPSTCECHRNSIVSRVSNTTIFGTETFLENRKKNWEEKYGVSNPMKVDEISSKVSLALNGKIYTSEEKKSMNVKKIATSRARNGTDWPQQNSEIFRRTSAAAKKKKEYRFESGRTIFVQGFEWKALDILLKEYRETDIIVSSDGKVPPISYAGVDGKQHIFYPDIYIPKDNLIIEVKSRYTYDKHGKDLNLRKNNELKAQFTKAAGYNFRFMIL